MLRSYILASLLGLVCVLAGVLVWGVGSALAVSAAPALSIHSAAIPAGFSTAQNAACPGSVGSSIALCDRYQVTVTNVGGAATNEAGEVVLTDAVPAGLTVQGVQLLWNGPGAIAAGLANLNLGVLCTTSPVRCAFPGFLGAHSLQPDETLEMVVFVTVNEPAGAGSLSNSASASVPGVAPVSTTVVNQLGGSLPGFGVESFGTLVAGVDGSRDVLAGDHPYELTTRIDLNSVFRLDPEGNFSATSVEDPRDVVVDLPLGFLGSALTTPTCTFAQLSSHIFGGVGGCPPDTVVGHIFTEPVSGASLNGPIYNMVAEHGVAAEFGFVDVLAGAHVLYASVAPGPEGYVLRTTAPELPQVPLTDIVATFYGNPVAKDAETICGVKSEPNEVSCREGLEKSQAPLFTNPSECSGRALSATVHIDSWQHPGARNTDGTPDLAGGGWASAQTPSFPEGLTGCDLLQFTPSFTLAPEAEHSQADEPAGYEALLKVPQSEEPFTSATPPLKTTVVTLPAGVAISPSAANGLVGCQETGPEGIELGSTLPGHCPSASKVGEVEATTPLLNAVFKSGVYVAQPSCGAPGQPECTEAAAETGGLFALYIEVGSEATGVHIKLKGKVEVGGNGTLTAREGKPLLAPGQIRTSFVETPQFPVGELKLTFRGGARAPLANPQTCGTFTTNASFEPWSAPDTGPSAIQEPSFAITGCENKFAPAFTAGTVNNQAGAYSPFTTTFSRHDGEQDLSGVEVKMPPGLLGKVAGIEQCPEAQANAGTCSAASKIGTATAAAGSGSRPFWQSGSVYLTGPYKSPVTGTQAPFGLSIVVPAKAGPYNLGNIVVRAAIEINPTTAAATIVSNHLPQSVDGVPLRVQTVNVTVGQENNFTFNATSCSPSSIGATLGGAQGAQASVSSPYNAANCAALPFKPTFTASTQGKTSKANGASLHVRIGFPTGGQANIHKVELTIPSVLPSRLTTLQKACPEAQFNSNPAGCPSASLIATAVAHTPLLPDPLLGPVYFVSHGGAAFPDTEMVLQGDNVELVVDGHTDIKKGVTYSRFETVPDAPVTSFEFSAPEGPNSIFAAFGNLCQKEIKAPTTITAQNGAVFSQDTSVEVENCPNTLTVISHTVKKRTITLKVAVPSAGKLTATGKHLTKAAKAAGGRGIITLILKATGHGKVNTRVRLAFAPPKGKHLTASVSARFK
jgi:hypothetical protein